MQCEGKLCENTNQWEQIMQLSREWNTNNFLELLTVKYFLKIHQITNHFSMIKNENKS